jgi:hypothetical protein
MSPEAKLAAMHVIKTSPAAPPISPVPGFSAAAWQERLRHNKRGEPLCDLANAIIALRGAPEWSRVLSYDEFSMMTHVSGPPP